MNPGSGTPAFGPLRAPVRVGVAGTGYIAAGLVHALDARDDMSVAAVLTRRDIGSLGAFPAAHLATNAPDAFFKRSDIVVECSGDPVHAADVVRAAFDAGLPVVTMNAEFHVTVGSWFEGRGVLSEAEGDQPGSLAALHEDAVAMGFRPLVYGNCKGFLNPDPDLETMRYWSDKLGIRLHQTVSFTDGTKIQIEQALAANGLGAGILCDGLTGQHTDDLEAAALDLASRARAHGGPVSDFVIAPGSGVAVFIAAAHDDIHREALGHFKLGPGPDYVLTRPFHLCYLEIPKTIIRLMSRGAPLLTNGRTPGVGVAAIAKRALDPGQTIARAIGSFHIRGEAVRLADHPHHLPIGLIQNATIIRAVAPGAFLTAEDVEIPASQARDMWRELSGAGQAAAVTRAAS